MLSVSCHNIQEMEFFKRVKNELKTITIEPFIFYFIFSVKVDQGAQITNNLMIWKICHLEKNLSETICSNLTLDEYSSINSDVQKEVVDIQSIGTYIGTVPAFIYSFFVGALSDDFGMKPLMVVPMIGNVLVSMSLLINYLFIETLPLQFFWMIKLSQFFGGTSVLYLGTYGYVATITSPKERAYRLARLDGIEVLASITGKFKQYCN